MADGLEADFVGVLTLAGVVATTGTVTLAGDLDLEFDLLTADFLLADLIFY